MTLDDIPMAQVVPQGIQYSPPNFDLPQQEYLDAGEVYRKMNDWLSSPDWRLASLESCGNGSVAAVRSMWSLKSLNSSFGKYRIVGETTGYPYYGHSTP